MNKHIWPLLMNLKRKHWNNNWIWSASALLTINNVRLIKRMTPKIYKTLLVEIHINLRMRLRLIMVFCGYITRSLGAYAIEFDTRIGCYVRVPFSWSFHWHHFTSVYRQKSENSTCATYPQQIKVQPTHLKTERWIQILFVPYIFNAIYSVFIIVQQDL